MRLTCLYIALGTAVTAVGHQLAGTITFDQAFQMLIIAALFVIADAIWRK